MNINKITARGKSILNSGEVALVGSGPGDAELLTIRAMRFIQQAEIAIYDRLVSDEILALLPDNCERFYVGKEQAKHCVPPQDRINEILVEEALAGKKKYYVLKVETLLFLVAEAKKLNICSNMVLAARLPRHYSGIRLYYLCWHSAYPIVVWHKGVPLSRVTSKIMGYLTCHGKVYVVQLKP